MVDLKAWMNKRTEEDERLYDRYGKPLERDHKGEYVAIGPEGGVVLGNEDVPVIQEAILRFGSGNFAFRRVGVEMKWRTAAV